MVGANRGFKKKSCNTLKTDILLLLVCQLDAITEKDLLKLCCSYATGEYTKKPPQQIYPLLFCFFFFFFFKNYSNYIKFY